jgi:hypothetical protein
MGDKEDVDVCGYQTWVKQRQIWWHTASAPTVGMVFSRTNRCIIHPIFQGVQPLHRRIICRRNGSRLARFSSANNPVEMTGGGHSPALGPMREASEEAVF